MPVDRSFKPESLVRKKIRPAFPPRSDEILEFPFPVDLVLPFAVVTHPYLSILLIHPVTDSRILVFKSPGGQPLPRRTARGGHRARVIRIGNLRVTTGARLRSRPFFLRDWIFR